MNKKVFLISILFLLLLGVGLCVWSAPWDVRIGAPDSYLVISSGPSISSNASGTYTYYIRGNGISVPTHPDPVSMTISGTAMGLGWIDFKITAITINGNNHLTDPQYGEAPTEEIGYMVAVGGIPFHARAKNDDFSFTVKKASAWDDDPGTYKWTASGQALRKLARWDGGQWVVHNNISDLTYTHATTNSGSWTVAKKNVCSYCQQTGPSVTSPTAHHVPCPNPNCNAGRTYWNCYGVPASHALLATCSNCNASSVYACSGHPNSCSSQTPSQTPPTDNTPNCSDCTSHCSSPCSCTNSGTCNGTVAAPPPPEPEPTLVACGRSACTASVSSSTEHESSPCSPSAGHTYYTCNPTVNVANWLNKHRVRTCRYSECGRSWQQCVTGTTPVCNKPFRKQNGSKCWAIE